MNCKELINSTIFRKALELGAALLLLPACGDVHTLAVVSLIGKPRDASRLLVVTQVEKPDGQKQIDDPLTIPVDQDRFSLRLPANTFGKLTVGVGAVKPGWRCLGGFGGNSPSIELDGQPQVDMVISMRDYAADNYCE